MTHLTAGELQAWHAGSLDHDRARVIDHLAGCAACAEQLAAIERAADGAEIDGGIDLAPFREVGFRAGGAVAPPAIDWRRFAIAAVVVLAVGSAAYFSRLSDGTSIQRGGGSAGVVPTSPVGEVSATSITQFTWSGKTERARLLVIDLAAGADPILERTTDGSSVELTDSDRARLIPGRTYRWFVEYRDASGALHSTATAQFSVR